MTAPKGDTGPRAVLDLLARYDDEALAALASRGLLRRARKDLEAVTPVVREDGADVVVEFPAETGGHVVRFGATGAVGARCSCPATTTCQHVLAAAIAVGSVAAGSVGAAAAGSGREESPGGGSAGEGSAPVTDHLAAFTAQDLLRHCGTAGYRWAWQFVEDLEAADRIRVEIAEAVVVRFLHPALTFRYVGGPLEGMVSDVPPIRIDRYRVAAVLAYQRAAGLTPAPPPPVRTAGGPAGQPGLDLGREFADDGSLADQRRRSRERLRTAVAALAHRLTLLSTESAL